MEVERPSAYGRCSDDVCLRLYGKKCMTCWNDILRLAEFQVNGGIDMRLRVKF